jgi:hypothetical protein
MASQGRDALPGPAVAISSAETQIVAAGEV